MSKRHKMPLICKVRRFFHGYSPSAILLLCTAGVKKKIPACECCEHYIHVDVMEYFWKGYNDAIKEIE